MLGIRFRAPLVAILVVGTAWVVAACDDAAGSAQSSSPRGATGSAATQAGSPATEPGQDTPASSFMTARLEAPRVSPLGGTVTLRFIVSSEFARPNAEVTFQLPPSVVPIGGEVRRPISLAPNVPQVFELEVLLTEPGEQKIIAGVTAYLDREDRFAEADGFYLDVAVSQTTLRRQPTPPPWPPGQVPAVQLTATPSPTPTPMP